MIDSNDLKIATLEATNACFRRRELNSVYVIGAHGTSQNLRKRTEGELQELRDEIEAAEGVLTELLGF